MTKKIKIIAAGLFLILAIVIGGFFWILINSKVGPDSNGPLTCNDSDNGKNIYIKGSATSKVGKQTLHINADSCAIKNENKYNENVADYSEGLSSCSGDNCYVHESYCGEYKGSPLDTQEFIQCPNGCSDGACLPDDKNNTSSWQTYRNEKQEFEIKFPITKKDLWVFDIRIDEAGDKNMFDGFFKLNINGLSLRIKRNLFTEITPLFPSSPFCKYKENSSIFQQEMQKNIYSNYKAGNISDAGGDCASYNDYIADDHIIEGNFCLDNDYNISPPEQLILEASSEVFYRCWGGKSLFSFSLSCNNEQWQGKNGQEKCSQLYDQILRTFKFIDSTKSKEISCTEEQRGAEVCAEIYAPVCATVEIQCIKAPCNPIK